LGVAVHRLREVHLFDSEEGQVKTVEQMALDLEIAYRESCAVNGKEPNDAEFFRAYTFASMALLIKRVEKMETRCRG
jgi:hypothetical protein